MATEQIIIEYIAQVEGMKAQLKSVQTELKAVQQTGVDAGKKTEDSFKKTETSAASLKTQLRTLKSELANATDPKDVERLARAAGQVANKIDDASKAARIFSSESKFEQVRNALGGIGRNLLSLNFKQAADESRLLASAVKSITFKEALGGLKDFGTTIINLGKSLLLNPIFLIGTAIAAVGVALFELKDRIPIVRKAFDFLGDSIGKVKDFITGITDSIGLTSVATDKAFDRLIAHGKIIDEQRAAAAKFREEELQKQKEAAAAAKKIQEDSIETYKTQYEQQTQAIKDANKKKLDAIKEDQEKHDKELKDAADAKLEQDKQRLQDFTDQYHINLERQTEAFQEQQDKEIDELKRKDELKRELLDAGLSFSSDISNAIFEVETQKNQAILDSETTTDAQKRKAALANAKLAKEQALFSIAIHTAEAVIKSIAASPETFGLPFAAFALASGAIQAGLVASKPLPKFAEGVIDLKGGVKGKDSIHSLLMPGESVMTTDETQRHKELLTSIRNDNLDKFIMDKYVNPKVSSILKETVFAQNVANSSKLNFPDEYALARVMSRNKGTRIENTNELAIAIAKEINKSNIKRTWS